AFPFENNSRNNLKRNCYMFVCVCQSCSQSFPCAGRAVRNAFLSHGPYPAKDKIHLARIIRRSYVGVELVQWLCEQCVYVRCRTTAARVWQVLLELGVLLSVDQRVVFSDSNTYYQFSFEECDSPSCEFRSNEGEWPEAVRLLLQLAPYVQFRSGGGTNSPTFVHFIPYPAVLSLPDLSPLFSQEELGRVCLKERGRDVLVLQRVTSSVTSPSDRYVVVSGTPLKILEHLLSDLRLDDQRGAPENRESEMLLDDFLLTYLVFMTTHDLCQALSARCRGQEEGKDALFRKRKVLQLVSHWSRLYKDFLKDEEHVRSFMKTLYRCVLEDLYEFPTLEKDLKEFQKLLRHSQHLFCAFWMFFVYLSVICCVHVSSDSYLSVHTHPLLEAHELLRIVGLKIDRAEDDMVLAVVSHTGGAQINTRSKESVLWKSSFTFHSAELSRRPVRLLGINTWDVAAALTHLDWSLFKSIHEQELVYYTLSRAPGSGHTVALSVLLQRCNEVQQWVMSEVLMCVSLNKRVQLLKKFIKIAAHCKAQRNLNSAFAIIMGLNTAAVSRLNQTWEKCPGKFKKLFSELELITDPSLNHKAYREAFKRMKPPKIPFMPLLLKDITFIHEGNKTFHDNLVNFEKLHMIADTVRMIRHCQSDQPGNEVIGVDSAEVRASVQYLHIIDNQQTLFELSHKLEPRA
uniref:Rap guanine nucleotide exchange factor (GEF) 5a n=1 Tax=Sphaeramia orbicularis TaxID=375764 RepID=A0A672YEY6_9TELE